MTTDRKYGQDGWEHKINFQKECGFKVTEF